MFDWLAKDDQVKRLVKGRARYIVTNYVISEVLEVFEFWTKDIATNAVGRVLMIVPVQPNSALVGVRRMGDYAHIKDALAQCLAAKIFFTVVNEPIFRAWSNACFRIF